MCLTFYIEYVNTYRGVTSERCWNKKSQPLLPHINTNLTMICGPKYLYDNSIIQLRILSTPHMHKNTCIETSEKSYFTWSATDLPSSWLRLVQRENALPHNFSLSKIRRVQCISNVPAFCWGDWFLSCYIWSAEGTDIVLRQTQSRKACTQEKNIINL